MKKNVFIKREQRKFACSAERRKGRMKSKLLVLWLAVLPCTVCLAQSEGEVLPEDSLGMAESAEFTFNESQLGENDDMTTEVIQVGSANNIYVSQIGYTWGGAMRFRYRALDNRYNDVHMNGVLVNTAENGRFNYSTIGGMNDAMRGKDNANPFEDNAYSYGNIGGAANYDLRAGSMASGHKLTLSGANRNYTLRAMYTYGSGYNKYGWAFFGTVGYRWANMETAYVEGTFYNSASYFLAAEKKWGEERRLNFATWGSPTERATQGSTVDEARWLTNNWQYNPSWGYQNGEKRSARVVNNYEPSALVSLEWRFNDALKLNAGAFFKYAMYSSSALKYNDAQNPAPDYWKNLPSAKYNPWPEGHAQNNEYSLAEYNNTVAMWQAGINTQINWDELYAKNRGRNVAGEDASYFMARRHNDHLVTNLAASLDINLKRGHKLYAGLQLGRDQAMHYQTISDMMGAWYLHNVNSYALGKYTVDSDVYQYDLNNPNAALREGDRYGYDYNIYTQNAKLWATYVMDKGITHSFISANINGTSMWRKGFMRNGIYKDNSYGKSHTADFLNGGVKAGTTINLGHGNTLSVNAGFERIAPMAYHAFQAPELNNNFANDLQSEKHVCADLGYSLKNKWVQLNVNGYFYHLYDITEFSQFYDDDKNSFTYNTLSHVKKLYYGAELGVKVNITNEFNVMALGTYSEAKYTNNATYTYTRSIPAVVEDHLYSNPTTCYSKGMREGGTPLAAASLALNYRLKGWYLSLIGNYYDRIYLSFAPNIRTEEAVIGTVEDPTTGQIVTTYDIPEQAKGNGGFMLDASIGRQFRLGGSKVLSINVNLCNLTNRQNITTGGFEQSRTNRPVLSNGSAYGNPRIYDFSKNPRKYYAQGFNFMINANLRF